MKVLLTYLIIGNLFSLMEVKKMIDCKKETRKTIKLSYGLLILAVSMFFWPYIVFAIFKDVYLYSIGKLNLEKEYKKLYEIYTDLSEEGP